MKRSTILALSLAACGPAAAPTGSAGGGSTSARDCWCHGYPAAIELCAAYDTGGSTG